jgi:signal transduction histidine kinase/CheY-like chemotaxis protein
MTPHPGFGPKSTHTTSRRPKIWNAPFAHLLGVDRSALKRGQTIAIDANMPPDASWLLTRIGELNAAAKRAGRPILVSHQAPRGSTLELFHNSVTDGYVTTILDVSEQRPADEARRDAQKLESLGRIMGGVAHDFNNLLTVIVGSLNFLRRFASGDKKAIKRINMIEIAAERASRLTKQLLAFARRQPLEPQVVNLDQVMHTALPLIRRAVGESVVVECVSAGGLWNVQIDTAQFQSVVLNLAINSRDAMPDGGKLTVAVSNAALDDVYASNHREVEPGQYVLFTMTDTGGGMDATTMARATEPFFTTKPLRQGTGLGLPQVYGFVKQSGGQLKLYSGLGEGTTVKIYLPRSLAQQTIGILPRRAHLNAIGSETILLVDDDEIVRVTVASMLEELGYTVLTAENAAKAIGLVESGAAANLLLTDVVMPVVGGRELAERVRELRPDIRILFTSGFAENAVVYNGQPDSGIELLTKPFDRERLATKIRRVLDREMPAR